MTALRDNAAVQKSFASGEEAIRLLGVYGMYLRLVEVGAS